MTHRTVTLTQSTDARKGPSSHATCDRGFDYGRGNRVEIHAQSGNFYWVKRLSDGDVGWIAKNSVGNTVPASSPAASTRETAPTNADTEVADYKAWVTNAPSGLNVRKTPSSSGSKVTKISNGKQVTVIKHNGNWRLVYFDGRVQGYVSGSYLTRNQPGRGDVITLPQAPQPNTNITNPFEGNRVTRPQAPQPNTNITNPFEGNRTRPNLGNKAWGYCESAKVGIAVFGGEKGVCWFANNSGDVVWFETTAAIYGWGLPVGVALAVGTANDGDLSKLEGFSNCDSVGVGPAGTTRCIGRDGGSDVSMRTVTIGVGPPAELSGGLSRAIKVHRETDPRHKESTRANICFAHAGLGDSQPPFCTPDVA